MSANPRAVERTMNAGPKLGSGAEGGVDALGSAFLGCIDRLQQLIDRESGELKSGKPVNFDDFNARKTHALLEFMRASRNHAAPRSPTMEAKLARLRDSLVENSSLLEQHLRAVREISGIMIRTIEMAESDGTYSNRVFVDR